MTTLKLNFFCIRRNKAGNHNPISIQISIDSMRYLLENPVNSIALTFIPFSRAKLTIKVRTIIFRVELSQLKCKKYKVIPPLGKKI